MLSSQRSPISAAAPNGSRRAAAQSPLLSLLSYHSVSGSASLIPSQGDTPFCLSGQFLARGVYLNICPCNSQWVVPCLSRLLLSENWGHFIPLFSDPDSRNGNSKAVFSGYFEGPFLQRKQASCFTLTKAHLLPRGRNIELGSAFRRAI